MSAKTGFSWSGLIPQFFFLILLPLAALLLVVTFGSLELHRQAMRTLVGQRDERAVRAAAQALTEQLNQRVNEIQMLASSISQQASSQELSDVLQRNRFLRANFDAGIAFFTPDGQLLVANGGPNLWDNPDILHSPDLMKMISQATSPGLYSPATEDIQGVMFVTTLVAPAGPIAVGAFYTQELIQHTLENIIDANGGGSAFVVTSGHQLLFSAGAMIDTAELTNHPGVDAASKGQSGSTFMQSGDSEHVVAYSPVAPLDWVLVIEEPWASVTSPMLRTTEYAPLVLIPLLILALIALWFVTRRIIQPLQGLEARANELAWGNYDTIASSTGGITEIRHLQAALVHLAQKVKASQQGLKGYIGAITMGQEEERRRLARELHDDTLQSMIALNQRIQLAQMTVSDKLDLEILEEIQELIEQTIQNLRRLTRDLRPIYLEDLGLVAALEMLTREIRQTSRIVIDFNRSGQAIRLSPPVELALYRISQEALSNTVRHSQAGHASLAIHYRSASVQLEISDDGLGFDVPESPAEFAPSGHFGLLGMHERTEMIGARLDIQSQPGKGSQITVTVPTQALEKQP
jgi:signal transduction histidine kinase